MENKRLIKRLKRPVFLIWMCVFAVLAVSISAPAMAQIIILPPPGLPPIPPPTIPPGYNLGLTDPVFVAAYTPVPPNLNDTTFDPKVWAITAPAVRRFTTSGGVTGAAGFVFDENNLYVAVKVEGDNTFSTLGSNDKVWLYFDNDNDGGVPCLNFPQLTCPEPGDDIFGFDGHPYQPYSPGFSDGFSNGTFVWTKDQDEGGSSDGAANEFIFGGTDKGYEFSHPHVSGDIEHDFNIDLNAGDTVGFGLRLTVDGQSGGWWPSSSPSSWGKVIFPTFFDTFAFDLAEDPPSGDNAWGTVSTITPNPGDSIVVKAGDYANPAHGFTNNYLEITHHGQDCSGTTEDTVFYAFTRNWLTGSSGTWTVTWTSAAYQADSRGGEVIIGEFVLPHFFNYAFKVNYTSSNTIAVWYKNGIGTPVIVDTGVHYDYDTPQTFKVVFDFDTNKFDLYIASDFDHLGSPIVAGLEFLDSGFSKISFLAFQAVGCGNNFVESYGLDNVMIYPGGHLDSVSCGWVNDANRGGDEDNDGICQDGNGDGFVLDPESACNGTTGFMTQCDDNCPDVQNPDQLDADGDGMGDACDPCPNDAKNDSDGDGLCADLDNCDTMANGLNEAAIPGVGNQTDTDGDGFGDACDNCPEVFNYDDDEDGHADTCTKTTLTPQRFSQVQMCIENEGIETTSLLYPDCCTLSFVGLDGSGNKTFPKRDVYCGPYIMQETVERFNGTNLPIFGNTIKLDPGDKYCVTCDIDEYFADYLHPQIGRSAIASTELTTAVAQEASTEFENVITTFEGNVKDPLIVDGECQAPEGSSCPGDTYRETYEVVSRKIEPPWDPAQIFVDIQPGTYPNDILLDRKGLQPVGIYSTPTFDASTIDPSTCTCAGAPVNTKKNGTLQASLADLNEDGVDDLIFQVETKELNLIIGDTEAIVKCTTYDGILLEGKDSVNLK